MSALPVYLENARGLYVFLTSKVQSSKLVNFRLLRYDFWRSISIWRDHMLNSESFSSVICSIEIWIDVMKQPKFKNYLRKLQIRVPDAFMGPADFCQPSKDEKEGNSRLAATQNTTTGKSVSSHSLSQTKRYKRAEGAEGAKYIFTFQSVQICRFSKFIVKFSIDSVIFCFLFACWFSFSNFCKTDSLRSFRTTAGAQEPIQTWTPSQAQYIFISNLQNFHRFRHDSNQIYEISGHVRSSKLVEFHGARSSRSVVLFRGTRRQKRRRWRSWMDGFCGRSTRVPLLN